MTTSVNPTLTNAELIFKELVWTPMLKVGENWLAVELPFLNLPVIKQLENFAFQEVTDAIFNSIVMFIDIETIQLKNAAHQVAYQSASLQLALIAQEKGITSNEFIKARDAAKVALSNLTYYGS